DARLELHHRTHRAPGATRHTSRRGSGLMAEIALINRTARQRVFGWLQPHRIVLIVIALVLVVLCVYNMRWDWLPNYADLAVQGLWRTIWLLVVTTVLGLALAIPLGFWQAAGPGWLGGLAKAFCTVIRGTPLLLQLWLLYFGLGSLFPQ